MRLPRVKISPEEGEALFHCTTRTVNGAWLWAERDQEVLRKQIWQLAEACGVEVLTYAILSNHFHVLVRVPRAAPVSDEELLRRHALRNPRPNKYQLISLATVRTQLATQDPEGLRWRERELKLMGDISQYMKLLKLRFSKYYNRAHRRFGTLYAERFTSVIVEGKDHLMTIMAAYIDLNAVRAGIVADPKDYRFCGYAEAVAGSQPARRGLQQVVEIDDWPKAQAVYRTTLYAIGAGERAKGKVIPAEHFNRVVRQGGKLPLADTLHCRVRYLTRGAVLGSEDFVARHFTAYCARTGLRLRPPRELPVRSAGGAVMALHGLRSAGFG